MMLSSSVVSAASRNPHRSMRTARPHPPCGGSATTSPRAGRSSPSESAAIPVRFGVGTEIPAWIRNRSSLLTYPTLPRARRSPRFPALMRVARLLTAQVPGRARWRLARPPLTPVVRRLTLPVPTHVRRSLTLPVPTHGRRSPTLPVPTHGRRSPTLPVPTDGRRSPRLPVPMDVVRWPTAPVPSRARWWLTDPVPWRVVRRRMLPVPTRTRPVLPGPGGVVPRARGGWSVWGSVVGIERWRPLCVIGV